MNLNDLIEEIEEFYPDYEVEVYENEDLKPGQVAVGGFFTPDPFAPSIEIALQVSASCEDPYEEEIVNDISKLQEEIYVTVMHEERHWNQFQSQLNNGYFLDGLRAHLDESRESYLGDKDEMDAFSTCDLARFVELNGWASAFSSKYSILSDYINVFGKNSPITKKIIKKAYKSLNCEGYA